MPEAQAAIDRYLPENFQTAEYLLEHGMVDIVAKRQELRETLGRVVRLLRHPNTEVNETAELLPAPSA